MIKITKILNSTDLGLNGSHGGITVGRPYMDMVKNFFGDSVSYKKFHDKKTSKIYDIQYAEYSANGTTPNDRVTPIGAYATDNNIKAGDLLHITKDNDRFYIDFEKKQKSFFIICRGRGKIEILNIDKSKNCIENYLNNNVYEFISNVGVVKIYQETDVYKMMIDNELFGKNNEYYEVDVSTSVITISDCNPWRIDIQDAENDATLDYEVEQLLAEEIENEDFNVLDNEYKPKPENKKDLVATSKGKAYPRDVKVSKNALARANFLCEFDNQHKLFVRKNKEMNYTEPHHLIPLKYHLMFSNSLDVEANIVSLCSHCHNLLHYGSDSDVVIRELFLCRRDELKGAGICKLVDGRELTIDILLGLYL